LKCYEGLVEDKLFNELESKKPIYKTLFMTSGISYLDWENVGFSPENILLSNLKYNKKVLINILITYNLIS